MITEDYVSFEIAQLLKEKGFNEDVTAFYNSNGKFEYCSFPLNHNLDIGSGFTSAPTQHLALKWLREEHLYHIFAKPVQLKNRVDWKACIIAEDCDTLPITIHGESPEQAVEAALDYVLKNLI